MHEVLPKLIQGVAKLCDFGWAVYNVDEYRTTVCGTPVYKTP